MEQIIVKWIDIGSRKNWPQEKEREKRKESLGEIKEEGKKESVIWRTEDIERKKELATVCWTVDSAKFKSELQKYIFIILGGFILLQCWWKWMKSEG